MSIRMVADTHTIIWYLNQDDRLSVEAQSILNTIDDSEDQVAISSMTLVEIVYLAERSRIHPDLLEIVLSFLDDPDSSLVEIPLNREIVRVMEQIPKEEVPEMPDRIIGSTAMYLDVPLITKDHKLQESVVPTVW